MPQLLVSVRDAAEARIALCAGAGLIDVKEPARGPLGAADRPVVEAVVREVGGAVPVSVALGELVQWPCQNAWPLAEGVHFCKLGLSGCARRPDWTAKWRRFSEALPPRVAPVAVVYADWTRCAAPDPQEVLLEAGRLGCRAVLVDTFDKSAGSLFDWWHEAALARFVRRVRDSGLIVVLAGSLTVSTIPRAAALGPDFVAVRGAACRHGREGAIEAELVSQLAELVGQPKSHHSAIIA